MRAMVLFCAVVLGCRAMAYVPDCNVTRGLYLSAAPLLHSGYWGPYQGGFEFSDVAHSGVASAYCACVGGPGSGGGVSQQVTVNQQEAAPLKVSGWSKAVDVEGQNREYRYSIYLDIRHTDGTSTYGVQAQFSPGTHDWEYSETMIELEKPIAAVSFFAFVREKPGAVYFDDLFLGPSDGENLLRNAGFEPDDRQDTLTRDRTYATLADLNVNAIHTYLSGSPDYWRKADGSRNASVEQFLSTAREKGMGVWLTLGHPPMPGFKDADDPNFPIYECVNGPWGEAWTEGLRLASTYDLAGISLVPDEYNWLYGRLKQGYEKHADPRVVEFYAKLPAMCDCPICRERYRAVFGRDMPELGTGSKFPAQAEPYLDYLQHRYDSTTAWMKRSAEAVKSANSAIRTDSLICVTPICSDFWWGPGVAWDRIGYESDIDFPTTDPYIQLHNYLGDSTHWYVTETAAHLTGSTPKRQCGIVLEASRLRKEFRQMDPVEVYGSALSAVCHGAKELAWWHYTHITGTGAAANPELSYACVKGVYELLEQADGWLGGLQPYGGVAYLHSRASDDFWRFYSQPEPNALLTHAGQDERYAAVAQREMLYYLFRRGVPTDLYYLEQVTEQQLADYRVIVVPFPFAVSADRVALLRRLAGSGKRIVVVSEFGTLDETGRPHARPALLELLGLKSTPSGEFAASLAIDMSPPKIPEDEQFTVYADVGVADDVDVVARVGDIPAVWYRNLGKGRVYFMSGPFGYDSVANRDNQERTHDRRILPDPIAPGHARMLDTVIEDANEGAHFILQTPVPGKDIEATCLRNSAGDLVVLVINWENEPVECTLQVPAEGHKPTLWGYRIGPDGGVAKLSIEMAPAATRWANELTLGPQEASVWRMLPK